MITREQLKAENAARKKAAKAARRRAPCRCCGTIILETVWSDRKLVDIANVLGNVDRSEEVHWPAKPLSSRSFGYNGICTLRCALAWADKRAPAFRATET